MVLDRLIKSSRVHFATDISKENSIESLGANNLLLLSYRCIVTVNVL